MSLRNQGSSSESLAEALSRVVVTRPNGDQHDNYGWATQHGRGDRMPRFLERAIEEVPHAARHGAQPRYVGVSRRPLRRTALVMSIIAVGAGIGVSVAGLAGLDHAVYVGQRVLSSTFSATPANAAMPRLAFGEVLRNYSIEAAAQAARANIIVRDVAPGTLLSAGSQVSETEWSLPQSDLDNLVITFPSETPPGAMRATMQIPGKAPTSSGSFSVELRQAPAEAATATDAGEAASDAPTPAVDSGAAEPAADEATPAVAVKKARAVRPDGSDDVRAAKRKLRPQAALSPKKSDTGKVAAIAPAKPPAQVVAAQDANQGSGGTLLGTLFPFNAGTPNQLTMFSLGGPFPLE